jgi:hypothetical protein
VDDGGVIRNAVLHLTNEQPLLADLFEMPKPTDSQVVCTRLRSMNGKRPVFADDIDSVFLFPLAQVRFVEIPPGAEMDGDAPRRAAPAAAAPSSNGNGQGPDSDLDLDEDFLRRVREA